MKRILSLLLESIDLFLTFRPGSKGYKIFGRPGFGGGPGTKYAQLDAGKAKVGEPYSTLICLSAVRVPVFFLSLLRKRGAKVIVNQNGVYYPLWCGEIFRSKNEFLAKLNRAATHTFFQSQFSVDSYQKWVGTLPPSWSLLYNAVDLDRFQPGSRNGPFRVLVFLDIKESTRGLWNYFAVLAEAKPEYQWVFMGRAENSDLVAELQATMKGEWHLSPGASEVADTLRSCDTALHFVFNDVCPNRVLECLASGVHSICTSAGGGKELVAKGGGEVLPVKEGYESVDYPKPADVYAALQRASENRQELAKRAREASARYDLVRWTKTITGRENTVGLS